MGKMCFLLRKIKFWIHHELERPWIKLLTTGCIILPKHVSNENTSGASLLSKQWSWGTKS